MIRVSALLFSFAAAPCSYSAARFKVLSLSNPGTSCRDTAQPRTFSPAAQRGRTLKCYFGMEIAERLDPAFRLLASVSPRRKARRSPASKHRRVPELVTLTSYGSASSRCGGSSSTHPPVPCPARPCQMDNVLAECALLTASTRPRLDWSDISVAHTPAAARHSTRLARFASSLAGLHDIRVHFNRSWRVVKLAYCGRASLLLISTRQKGRRMTTERSYMSLPPHFTLTSP